MDKRTENLLDNIFYKYAGIRLVDTNVNKTPKGIIVNAESVEKVREYVEELLNAVETQNKGHNEDIQSQKNLTALNTAIQVAELFGLYIDIGVRSEDIHLKQTVSAISVIEPTKIWL